MWNFTMINGVHFALNMLRKKPSPHLFSTPCDNMNLLDDITCVQFQHRNRKTHRGHIVVMHGLNTLGGHDPRCIQLASQIANMGFQTYLPHIPTIADHRIDYDATSQCQKLLKQFQNDITEPFGIFAPSYLGSIVLDALARSDDLQQVIAVCTLGSFFDVNAFLDFVVESPLVDLYAVTVLLKNMIRQNQLWHDNFEIIFKQIFENIQKDAPLFHDMNLRCLSDDEINLLNGLVDPKHFYQLYHSKHLHFTPPDIQIPKNLENITAQISIVHGLDDNVIPSTHAQQLAKHLVNCKKYLAITPVITHGDYNIGLSDIPSIITLMRAFGKFFTACSIH